MKLLSRVIRIQWSVIMCHFIFVPAPAMLYILHMGNHPDMTHYRDGQDPILHLQVDMETAINWADQNRVRWAFSDRNAGIYYVDFHNSRNELDKIDWKAVISNDFRDPVVKEGKHYSAQIN